MHYRVLLQRLAAEDLDQAYRWAANNAPTTATRWLDRFQTSLRTLSTNPERCPLAKENGKVEVELREYLFGRKPNIFRVIFTIDGDAVRILRIRRAQRRPLSRPDIGKASEPDSD